MIRNLTQAAPIIVLGVALWMMICREVPAGNKDIVLAIVSGLLGYLAREAVSAVAKATSSNSPTPQVQPDPQNPQQQG